MRGSGRIQSSNRNFRSKFHHQRPVFITSLHFFHLLSAYVHRSAKTRYSTKKHIHFMRSSRRIQPSNRNFQSKFHHQRPVFTTRLHFFHLLGAHLHRSAIQRKATSAFCSVLFSHPLR